MKLLDRMARSNGNLERTVVALRLINQRLLHELSRLRTHSDLEFSLEDLAAYFDQSESQQKENALALQGVGVNSGVIDIAGETIVDINNTFENAVDGVIQGNGTLDISGANFTNNGTIAPTVTVIN